jgi:hypothetical protein
MTALPDPTVDLDWSGYVCLSSPMVRGWKFLYANQPIDRSDQFKIFSEKMVRRDIIIQHLFRVQLSSLMQ